MQPTTQVTPTTSTIDPSPLATLKVKQNGTVNNIQPLLQDFITRLTSRKFLLALAAAIICYLNKDWNGLVTVVSIYMGANAVATKIGQTQPTQIQGSNMGTYTKGI